MKNKTPENDFSSERFDTNNSNMFAVPDGYFDALPELINQKLPLEKSTYKSQVSRKGFVSVVLVGVCAAVVVAFLFINTKSNINREIPTVTDIHASEKYSYLEYLTETNQITDDELIELVQFDDTTKQSVPVFIEPNALQNTMLQLSGDTVILTPDDIIEYLLNGEDVFDDPDYSF